MIQWQTEPVLSVVVCLPQPHAQRLASEITNTLHIPATAQTAFQPVDAATVYVIMPEDAMQAQSLLPTVHIAVLSSADDTPANYPGMTMLTGALPQNVLAWLQTLEPQHDTEAPLAPDLEWKPSSAPLTIAPPTQGLALISHQSSIAVYSSGGGVGKTTTAVYLAALAASKRINTGLVELDEDRRGILTYFNKQPKSGLDMIAPSDWAQVERFNATMAQIAVKVDAHLSIVPMVGTTQGMQYMSGDKELHDGLPLLYSWAEHQFDLTIYDLPARIRDHVVLSTLQQADHIILVLEPTEIMLDSTLGYLKLIESLKDVGSQIIQKMQILVNKTPKQRAIGLVPQQMADSLGLPLLGKIPLDPERYINAINHHQIKPDAPWATVFDSLHLINESTAEQKAKGKSKLWPFHRRVS